MESSLKSILLSYLSILGNPKFQMLLTLPDIKHVKLCFRFKAVDPWTFWKSENVKVRKEKSEVWKHKQILISQTYFWKTVEYLIDNFEIAIPQNRFPPHTHKCFDKDEFRIVNSWDIGKSKNCKSNVFEKPELWQYKQRPTKTQRILKKHWLDDE